MGSNKLIEQPTCTVKALNVYHNLNVYHRPNLNTVITIPNEQPKIYQENKDQQNLS